MCVCVCVSIGQLYHQYSPVAVSVDAPELDVGLGSDRGGSRGAVDQSQLSEAAALADAGGPLTVHTHLRENTLVSESIRILTAQREGLLV